MLPLRAHRNGIAMLCSAQTIKNPKFAYVLAGARLYHCTHPTFDDTRSSFKGAQVR
jgi:hypothetical protein